MTPDELIDYTSIGMYSYLNSLPRIDPNKTIEQSLADLYAKLKKRQPAFDYKVIVHPSILKAAGWAVGDLVTEYKIPVAINANIQEVQISDNAYQSDIWIVGKPRQRRKFRHYKRILTK